MENKKPEIPSQPDLSRLSGYGFDKSILPESQQGDPADLLPSVEPINRGRPYYPGIISRDSNSRKLTQQKMEKQPKPKIPHLGRFAIAAVVILFGIVLPMSARNSDAYNNSLFNRAVTAESRLAGILGIVPPCKDLNDVHGTASALGDPVLVVVDNNGHKEQWELQPSILTLPNGQACKGDLAVSRSESNPTVGNFKTQERIVDGSRDTIILMLNLQKGTVTKLPQETPTLIGDTIKPHK